MKLLAYEEAAAHYERALQALTRQAPDEVLRCELLVALGTAQRRAGEPPQARDTFQKAAALARTLRARSAAQAPSLLARAALGRGEVQATFVAVDQSLVAFLEEVLDALGEEDSLLRARVLARLAMELYYSKERERRVMLSAQAVAMARRLGDPATLAAVLSAQRYAIWAPENLAERLAVATEMIAQAEEVADQRLALLGRFWRVVDCLEQGDWAVVDREIAAHARLAEELRQPLHLWYGQVFRAMRELLSGRFEEGERLIRQAFAQRQRVPSQLPLQIFSVQMFQLRTEQGRLQELEEGVKTLVHKYPVLPVWRCALAYLYGESRREGEARREFTSLAANDFVDFPLDANWLIGMALLSEVCALLGDARAATTLYELLLPYAERNVIVASVAACYGPVSHYLGLLAATMGRWQQAHEHFTAALQRNEQLGARAALAHTQHAYARMLFARKQRGDQTKAREMLDVALATAQELGMAGLVEKIKGSVASGQSPVASSEVSILPSVTLNPEPRTLNPSIFRQEGDYWTVGSQGTVFRLKDTKGLHYLSHLLRHPDQEFYVLDLVTMKIGSDIHVAGVVCEPPLLSAHGSGLNRSEAILDPQARTAYKDRLQELREELEEAQGHNDLGRVDHIQQEMDFLTQELAGAVGLGGRPRQAAPHVERARVNVTKAIKTVLKKITESDQVLGRSLATTIKTGTFCSYIPDPRFPIAWQL